jgi:hypothetical protein
VATGATQPAICSNTFYPLSQILQIRLEELSAFFVACIWVVERLNRLPVSEKLRSMNFIMPL